MLLCVWICYKIQDDSIWQFQISELRIENSSDNYHVHDAPTRCTKIGMFAMPICSCSIHFCTDIDIILGHDSKTGQPVYVPLKNVLPMVDPKDIVVDGWDISSLDIGEAVKRAAVLDYDLQEKLKPHLKQLKPRPSIYKEKFIALNQVYL